MKSYEVKRHSKTAGKIYLPAKLIGKKVTVNILTGIDVVHVDEAKDVPSEKVLNSAAAVVRAICKSKSNVSPRATTGTRTKREDNSQSMATCKYRSRFNSDKCDHAFHHEADETNCRTCKEYVKEE